MNPAAGPGMNVQAGSRELQEALLFANTYSRLRSGRIRSLVGIAAYMLVTATGIGHAADKTTAQDFAKRIAGEWVGVCEQSTDGQQAENKYFHAVIRRTSDDTLESKFSYYRADPGTGEPIPIGDTTSTTTIGDDGTVKSEMAGEGTIIVEKKPKKEKHQFAETLTVRDSNSLDGRLTGKISVEGLPFGVGKNGQISDGCSTWTLDGDVLTINQTIKAGFRVLMFKKEFTVVANNRARRGSDVAALTKASRVASKSECAPSGS